MVGLNVHRDHSRSLLGTGKTGTDRVNLNLGDLGTIHQEGTISQRSELRSCVKVVVAVLGSPSLTYLTVSQCGRKATLNLNMCSQ